MSPDYCLSVFDYFAAEFLLISDSTWDSKLSDYEIIAKESLFLTILIKSGWTFWFLSVSDNNGLALD